VVPATIIDSSERNNAAYDVAANANNPYRWSILNNTQTRTITTNAEGIGMSTTSGPLDSLEQILNRNDGNDDAHSALNEVSSQLQGQIHTSHDIRSGDTYSRPSRAALSSDDVSSHLPHGTTTHEYPASRSVEDTAEDESFIVDHNKDGSFTVERVMAVIFRWNGVKLDHFHFMKGYTRTLEKSPGIHLTLSGLSCDAVFMISNDDIERERHALKDKLFNNPKSPSYQNRDRAINVSKLRTLCPGSKLLDYCKQHIVSLGVLAWCVQSAVHLCADVKDAAMQEVPFSRVAWKLTTMLCIKSERAVWSTCPTSTIITLFWTKLEQGIWCCVRGTLQLEGFHNHSFIT
jgi:hypothetical protein